MGIREWMGGPDLWLCTQCGFHGKPDTKLRGSSLVTLLLLFFFIIPGLIYSAWRGSTRYKACKMCGSANVIPDTSPLARQLLERRR